MIQSPTPHTITVTTPGHDDLSIYARLFQPIVGLIIDLERTHPDVTTATLTAIVTAVDNTGISYVHYDNDQLDTIGWDTAIHLVNSHPELHTTTHTRWQQITRIHIW